MEKYKAEKRTQPSQKEKKKEKKKQTANICVKQPVTVVASRTFSTEREIHTHIAPRRIHTVYYPTRQRGAYIYTIRKFSV